MTEQEKKEIYKFLKKQQERYFQLSQKASKEWNLETSKILWAKYQAISDLTVELLRKDWAAYENT